MSSITWWFILVFLFIHVIIGSNASASSSDESGSSKDSSSGSKTKSSSEDSGTSVESSSRQKPSKEKRASEESHPKSLDGSARNSENVVQPSEKSSSVLPSPAPSIAPDPASPASSTPEPEAQTSSTTTAKPKKSLSGASFFIGFAVGIMVIGMIVAAVRFWMHRRAERRVPYTIY